MDAGFDALLTADDVAFDARDAALLRAIDAEGSLNAVADSLGRSYSRAHGSVEALEDAFGPLVDRQRGGSGDGGSVLTENATELLARYDRLRTGYEGIAETMEAVLEGVVEARDGELGEVSTSAGRLRALVPPDAERVSVAVRADAVTLPRSRGVPVAGRDERSEPLLGHRRIHRPRAVRLPRHRRRWH